jgi:uncharacterized membrane protein YphA (DoxX/SURF4 family)
MKNFLSNKIFQFLLRLIVGGLFIFLSWDKMFQPEMFAKSICAYKMGIPDGLVNFIAGLLPFVEFIAGTFLILGIYKKGSSMLIIIMLVVFLAGLGQAYARGLTLNCGCGFDKPGEVSNLPMRMIEDAFMLIGTFIIYFFCEKKYEENIRSDT